MKSRSTIPVCRFPAPCSFFLLAILPVLAACSCRRSAPPKPFPAFVVNNQSNTLAVVDLSKFRVVASIPVGHRPEKVVVRPGSHELYVASASGDVSVVAFPELRVIATLRIARTVRGVTFSPDGRQAFALDPTAGQIVFIDCDQRREVARIRVGAPLADMALTPDGKTLVAADGLTNRLWLYGVESRQALGSVEVRKGPGPMVILPDSSKVFVADTGEEQISVADIASRQILAHIEIGTKPSALALKPDGGELFVLSAADATMTIIDTSHDNLEMRTTTAGGPAAAVIGRAGGILYIASASDGTIMTFDIRNRVVVASTHVGRELRALALSPDERFLVAADSASSSLAVMRTDRSTLVTTIPVGARPVDVVVTDWLWPR